MSGSQVAPNTANAVENGIIPKEGPKVLTLILPFPGGPFNFNLLQQIQQGQVSNIQCLFIDNSANNVALQMTVQITGQKLIVPPQAQGVFPIFWPLSSQITFTGYNGSPTAPVSILCLNVPLPLCVWPVTAFSSPAATQQVADAILDATVSGGYVNVSDNVTGNAGVVYPRLVGTNAARVNVGTNTLTTLIAGSPSWYASTVFIQPSLTATLAVAGEITVTLTDAGVGGAGTLLVAHFWIPSVAGSVTGQQVKLENIEWISKASSGALLQTQLSGALATGTIDVQVWGGTTTKTAV